MERSPGVLHWKQVVQLAQQLEQQLLDEQLLYAVQRLAQQRQQLAELLPQLNAGQLKHLGALDWSCSDLYCKQLVQLAQQSKCISGVNCKLLSNFRRVNNTQVNF